MTKTPTLRVSADLLVSQSPPPSQVPFWGFRKEEEEEVVVVEEVGTAGSWIKCKTSTKLARGALSPLLEEEEEESLIKDLKREAFLGGRGSIHNKKK